MIDIDGVSPRLRVVQNIQKCRSGRLLLVCDVTVPGDARCVLEKEIISSGVVRPAVDEMDLRIAFGAAIGRMDVQAAEVSAEIEGFLDGQIGEILVEKD